MQKELPKLLGVDEVASKLGVSESSVLRLARSGQLPSMKLGGKRKFAHHDVWVYLQSLRRKSLAEAQERNQAAAAKATTSQLELATSNSAVANPATH